MQLDLKGKKIFLFGSCLLFSPQNENSLSGPRHLGIVKVTLARAFHSQDFNSVPVTRSITSTAEKLIEI